MAGNWTLYSQILHKYLGECGEPYLGRKCVLWLERIPGGLCSQNFEMINILVCINTKESWENHIFSRFFHRTNKINNKFTTNMLLANILYCLHILLYKQLSLQCCRIAIHLPLQWRGKKWVSVWQHRLRSLLSIELIMVRIRPTSHRTLLLNSL